MISIKGLNKAKVLAALYNVAKPQGMGFLQYNPKPMDEKEAQQILDSGQTDFDYLRGRVMKVNLSKDEFDPWLFDRDNGDGAVAKAISALRSSDEVNPTSSQDMHKKGVLSAAASTKELMKESTVTRKQGIPLIHLGLNGVADVLGPKVDDAVKNVRPKLKKPK